jgi:putative hemolysin
VRPVPFTSVDFFAASAPRPLVRAIDALTGLSALQRLYASTAPNSQSFPERALATLEIGIDAGDASDFDRVPATGPLLVVANHPHGALDGLAVAALLCGVRSDVKLLANHLLARIPEMREYVVPIDSFSPGRPSNAGGVRGALEWLRAGHALVVFPAGEVSHVRAADGRIVDAVWRDGAVRLAARADAPVLPVFVHGQNSEWFVRAGRISPWLRSAMLGRELLRQRGRTVRLSLGRVVSQRRLAAVGDAPAQSAYLRVRTYGLVSDPPQKGSLLRGAARTARVEPVAAAVPTTALASEIAALPGGTRLLTSGDWQVHYVTADHAPLALQEIGRLREATFRAAGEGTGRASDLDTFDAHYRHLFVWHQQRRMIAGAYRIAATDEVMARQGLAGLYTRSLFRYQSALLRDLGPSLELGRSFVRVEFQRDYQPLLLLWRGIGAVVAANPRYRMLFGPVSISAEYGPTTRQLLARLLLANRGSLLQSFVVPRRPLPEAADGTDALVHSRVAGTLQEVDALVRELESDQRGLPVLLRHYLKLNAKLLGFSVDPAFGNVLDGLVVVDLLDVDRALLGRYLGKEAARAFVAAHDRGRELEAALAV